MRYSRPLDSCLTAGADRSLLLWDLAAREQIRQFDGVAGAAAQILDIWLPNEHTLAAICNDGTAYLWNLETGQLLHTVTSEWLIAGVGVPSDHLTISADLDYNIRIRRLPGGDALRVFRGHTTSVHSAVAFSPDGKFVLSGGTEKSTRLWDRQSGQPVREFIGSSAGTMAAAFSPDGSRVLTTTGVPKPAARLWKTETGELQREFSWTGGWPMSAVFSPDGGKVAAREQSKGVRIFDVESGALIRILPNNAWSGPMAFSPGAPLLGAASGESEAVVYDYETGAVIRTISQNAGPVVAVAFSQSGGRFLVGWSDGLVRVHETDGWTLVSEFVSPAAFLEAAIFSPDEQYVLTGDGWPFLTATLWDARTGQPLRTFAGHAWTVSALAFSADGKSILTGAERVREWSIADYAARLSIAREADTLRLAWSVGELQVATHVNGPWLPALNAISPLIIPTPESAQFYRAWIPE